MADISQEPPKRSMSKPPKRSMSKQQLFKIFLKTGRKRVTLSIISGTLIFLVITGLVMIVYTHRFQTFQDYQEQKVNWYEDGKISVGSNYEQLGIKHYESDYFTNVTNEFLSLATGLIPNINIDNYTTAFSAEFKTYEPPPGGGEPWVLQEIMTFENSTYEVLAGCLIEGRLPKNHSELLWQRNNATGVTLNQTMKIYSLNQANRYRNYTIVGIIDNVKDGFRNASLSIDIFDWYFEGGFSEFLNYRGNNRFYTNMSQFQTLMNNLTSYSGVLTYLLDAQYDLTQLKLNGLDRYMEIFPSSDELPISETIHQVREIRIELAPDLKVFIVEYGEFWLGETTKILSINAPLLFILGLISVVTLSIGSRELGTAFRRMKLYGLSYNDIRKMVVLENVIFTMVSFVGGLLIGFTISYLFTMNIKDLPSNYYLNFLSEPLLITCLIAFVLGFFGLSFFIQNSIAKKTAKTTIEEYKRKRGNVKNLFSTSEFRLMILSLIFSAISSILYLVFYYAGPGLTFTTGLSFLTIFWFLIACSAALIITFVFLLIARLISLFWSLVSKQLWSNRLNMFTLSIKQLSVNKGTYQVAVLGALIFGLVVLPGFTMETSIQNNIANEAIMEMGGASLIVDHWIDPENEFDGYFSNITEIEVFTEAIIFKITNDNDPNILYPKDFEIQMLALDSPTNYSKIIDTDLLNNTGSSYEDLLMLEDDFNILMNNKHAQANRLKPGDLFNTIDFTRFSINLTMIDTYKLYPLLPISKKPVFFTHLDVFSMVGSTYTVREIIRSLALSTDVSANTVKLIKPINESVIPLIQQKLEAVNITAVSLQEVIDEKTFNIDTFSQNNLLFSAVLAAFTLIFVGYFTGIRLFEERSKIIESLYRVGAVRGQILRFFTFEFLLVNSIPLIVMVIGSLPVIRFVALYFLGANEVYSPYQPGVPAWIIIIVILAGLLITTIGWLLSLIPALYRYRPVKQE